jgi:RNA polymerase sigma-70 factor, ECF subfamily
MTAHNCGYASTRWEGSNTCGSEVKPGIELTEAEIIRRAQRGDSAAFEHIYQLHSPRIYGLCLRIVRNPTEAEDLTQEAFLLVFRKIQTFRGESAFPTWLHRLALNVVLMQLRKKNSQPASLEPKTKPIEEGGRPSVRFGGSDSQLAGLIDRLHLKRAVGRLPLAHKIVFMLHDVQGYKHSEIAKMMDCSVGTSKGQLHRARKRLRSLLRENEDSLPLVARSAGHGNECAFSY